MSCRGLLALEQVGVKLGLDQIRALLRALGHPERAYPSLVIAGTNGKGSVTAMVERALRAAGCRTGRYTSPHLTHLEERVAIDGQPIDASWCDALAARVLAANATLAAPATFFEATTALALEAFREAHVDVAVLEVGLGGRLDATNAVDSRAVAITAVDYDHEAWLGHTLEEIAAEKAGVIKPGGLAVLGENPARVCAVVLEAARARRARLVYAPDGVTHEARMVDGRLLVTVTTPHRHYDALTLGLRGRHQIANTVTAVRLLEELSADGDFRIDARAIRTGVEDVVWPGRLELVTWRGIQVLLDGAHNPSGARALAAYVSEAYPGPLPVVLGVMRDKRIDDIVAAMAPVASHIVCTAAASPRAATPAEMEAAVRRAAPQVPCTVAPVDPVAVAARFGTPVVVAGSLFLVGEVRAEASW